MMMGQHQQQPWHHNADALDNKVVHILARSLCLTDFKVRQEILSRKTGSVSATYHVLVKRKESGQSLPYSSAQSPVEKWSRVPGHLTNSLAGTLKLSHCSQQLNTSQQTEVTQDFIVSQSDNVALSCTQDEGKLPNRQNSVDQRYHCTSTKNHDKYENTITSNGASSSSTLQTDGDVTNQSDYTNYFKVPFSKEDISLSYKDCLQQLRKHKQKIYRGVLKSIGGAPESRFSSAHVTTVEAEDAVKPREKSASAKSVRFNITEEKAEEAAGEEENKNRKRKVTQGPARGSQRSRNSSRSPSEVLHMSDRSRRDLLLMARLRAKQESQVKSKASPQPNDDYSRLMDVMRQKSLTSIHSDCADVPPNSLAGRPYSSVSYLSRQLTRTSIKSNSSRHTRPSDMTGHHRLMVHSNPYQIHVWNFKTENLSMAGQKIGDNGKAEIRQHRTCRTPTAKSDKLPFSANRMKLRDTFPSACYSPGQLQGHFEKMAVRNSQKSDHEVEENTSQVSHDVQELYEPRRHRYSVKSQLIPRDSHMVAEASRSRLDIHIPTGIGYTEMLPNR